SDVSAGDPNGDGFSDLAVIAPGATIGGITNLGAVNLMPGSSAGLGSTSSQFYYPGPAAPGKLVGVAKSPTSIQLTWVNNAGQSDSMRLERSLDGVSWSPLTTLGASTTSYLYSSLNANTTYYYRMQYFNAAGSSKWTTVVTGTGAPVAPSNLT